MKNFVKSDENISTGVLPTVVVVSFGASMDSSGAPRAPAVVVVVSMDDTGDADGRLDWLLMIDNLECCEARERTRAKWFLRIILRPEVSEA